jgi:predicted nuclease with TOPRIM domain
MAKADPNEPVTREILDEAVDTLLAGMDKLYERFKGETDSLRSEMNSRFDNVENRLRNIEVELSYVKDEVNGLKADFSTTPSRREFEELKVRVDKHYPLI